MSQYAYVLISYKGPGCKPVDAFHRRQRSARSEMLRPADSVDNVMFRSFATLTEDRTSSLGRVTEGGRVRLGVG